MMASSSGASSSAPLPPGILDHGEGSQTVAELRRPSAASGGSSDGSLKQEPCAWRTPQFHNQECARYFDCPSHMVERRLSIDESHELPSNEPVRPADHNTNEDELYSSEAENDVPTDGIRNLMIDSDVAPTVLEAGPSAARETEAGGSSAEDPSVQRAGLSRSQLTPAPLSSEPSLVTFHELGDSASPSPLVEAPESPISPLSRQAGSVAISMFTPQERLEQAVSPSSPRRSHHGVPRDSPDFVLPRWQPDAEATYCPICYTQFSIFVRKHHCRKCGRVVCNSCSPHRIIIPHQYIVRPPGSEIPAPQTLLLDNLGAGYFDSNGISGGERVRLCNPCVPDPNIAPPQSSTTSSPAPAGAPYGAHHRARSSIGDAYGAATSPNSRYGMVYALSQSHDPYRPYVPRSRSSTIHPVHHGYGPSGGSSARNRGSTGAYYSTLDPFAGGGSSRYAHRYPAHRDPGSSSRQRSLPPPPQIAEEDECPICHRELPSRSLPNFEALRESHITTCIQSHSSYGSPRHGSGDTGGEAMQAAPRRTGMYTYSATEKDCIDDAECTICLEEFTVGVAMARLECLCRFHRSCISAWFVNHPGRCPVHQHDGFGY